MEAHGAAIHALVAAHRDITLAEIKAALGEQGIRASIGGLWRFFRRHQITLKKSRRTPPSRSAPMS
jgi:transposase